MGTGLYGIEWNGLSAFGGLFPARPWVNYRAGLIGLAAVLAVGCGGWMLLSDHAGSIAPTRIAPTRIAATAAVAGPVPPPATAVSQSELLAEPAIVPGLTSPVVGLKISAQHWRRGGLGSNAFVTFTVRNANHYAVKDIEVSCAFSRSDGSHLTDRSRVIHETVRRRSRKTFQHMHVGFVNVNADHAKCSLVGASRV